jgi:WD40 repeat protein
VVKAVSNGRVFISYASRDVKTARELEDLLRSDVIGQQVWRDERAIERDWSREVAEELAACRAVVLVWSEDAVRSEWVRHEWLTARALEKPIVPVMIDSTPLPAPLENLHGIVAANGRVDGRADAAVVARRLEAGVPDYDFTIRSPDVRIPLAPNPRFVGRRSDLLDLYLALVGDLNKLGVRSVGSVGMGGVGKTQLAVEFVHRFAFAFKHGVHWINAADAAEWVPRLVALARDDLRLGANGATPGSDQGWIRALRAHCAAHPTLLLVLDNVVEPKWLADERSLLGIAPLDLGCNLLFTTRRQFELPGVGSHSVSILSEAAAYELLTARRSPDDAEEVEHARAICAAVGDLPLALVLASAYLDRHDGLRYRDYRRHLAQSRLDTIDVQKLSPASLATRHEAAVRATLTSQWEAVSSEEARLAFRVAGLLPEGAVIPKGRLGVLTGLHQAPDALVRPLDDACLELQDLSLADAVDAGRGLRLHPLVQEFALGVISDPAAERAAASERMAKAYADAASLEHEYAARGPDGVIEDVTLGVEWSAPGAGRDALTALGDVLDAEASAFYRFPHGRYPAMFLQQIARRAALRGYDALSQTAARHLAANGPAHFSPLWRTQVCSHALVRTIVAHGSRVSAAVTPDGRRVVTVSEDGQETPDPAVIEVWDLATGRLIERIATETTGIHSVGFTSDGDHLITAGRHAALQFWHLSTGRLVDELHAGPEGVAALAVAPDRRTVITRGRHELVVWDLERRGPGRPLGTLDGDPGPIAFSADGRHAIVASMGQDESPPRRGIIEVWDVPSGERVGRLTAHESGITAVLAGNGWALTAGLEGTVRLWDTSTWDLISEVPLPSPGPARILPGGTHVLMGAGHRLVVLEVESAQVVDELAGHAGSLKSVDVLPDGRFLSGARDHTARIWRPGLRRPREVAGGHSAAVTTAVALNDVAATGAEDGELRLWEIERGDLLGEWQAEWGTRANAAAARGSRSVLTTSSNPKGGAVLALDVEEASETIVGRTTSRVPFIRLSGDERLLHVADVDGVAALALEPPLGSEGVPLSRCVPPDGRHLTAVAMAADANRLAISASDTALGASALFLFDMASGQLLATLGEQDDQVHELAITPDGKRIAFVTTRGLLGVWLPERRQPPVTLAQDLGDRPKLISLANTPLVVTAGDDMRVWDVEAALLRLQLGSHPGTRHLEQIGKHRILTASNDWTVSVWDLDAGVELATVAIDGAASVATVSPDGQTFLCGDQGGDVYAFQLVDG